jgi:hypothetical protein
LPAPGLAGEQDHRARHQAAAQDAVELADPGRAGAGGLDVDLVDGAGGALTGRR